MATVISLLRGIVFDKPIYAGLLNNITQLVESDLVKLFTCFDVRISAMV